MSQTKKATMQQPIFETIGLRTLHTDSVRVFLSSCCVASTWLNLTLRTPLSLFGAPYDVRLLASQAIASLWCIAQGSQADRNISVIHARHVVAQILRVESSSSFQLSCSRHRKSLEVIILKHVLSWNTAMAKIQSPINHQMSTRTTCVCGQCMTCYERVCDFSDLNPQVSKSEKIETFKAQIDKFLTNRKSQPIEPFDSAQTGNAKIGAKLKAKSFNVRIRELVRWPRVKTSKTYSRNTRTQNFDMCELRSPDQCRVLLEPSLVAGTGIVDQLSGKLSFKFKTMAVLIDRPGPESEEKLEPNVPEMEVCDLARLEAILLQSAVSRFLSLFLLFCFVLRDLALFYYDLKVICETNIVHKWSLMIRNLLRNRL